MSSQLYGNRAQRRAAQKLGKQTGGVLLHPDIVEQLNSAQQMFVAIVKTQGRVRIDEAVIESLKNGDRVTMKKDGGSLILTFVAGEPPPEGATE